MVEAALKKTYAEKLRDPRWQKRRLEILDKAKFHCLNCDSTDKELHVHHLLYERGKDPWEYEDKLLLPLCKDCHELIADMQADVTKLLAEFTPDVWGELHGALCDILGGGHDEHPFIVWGNWINAACPKQSPEWIWQRITQEIRTRRPLIRGWIESAKGIRIEEACFVIGFPPEQKTAMESLSSPRTLQFLNGLLKEVSHRDLQFQFTLLEERKSKKGVRN